MTFLFEVTRVDVRRDSRGAASTTAANAASTTAAPARRRRRLRHRRLTAPPMRRPPEGGPTSQTSLVSPRLENAPRYIMTVLSHAPSSHQTNAWDVSRGAGDPRGCLATHLAELSLAGRLRGVSRQLLHDLEALVVLDQPQVLVGKGRRDTRPPHAPPSLGRFFRRRRSSTEKTTGVMSDLGRPAQTGRAARGSRLTLERRPHHGLVPGGITGVSHLALVYSPPSRACRVPRRGSL